MNGIIERDIQCPYCGEVISVLIDGSVPQQDYIEDCQVCCKPINMSVTCDSDGGAYIEARNENE